MKFELKRVWSNKFWTKKKWDEGEQTSELFHFFSTFVSCLRRRAADEFMRTCWRIFPRVSIVFQDGHFDDWNHVDRRLTRPSRCCRLNISVTFRINVIAPSRALCFWGSVEPSCGSLFLFFSLAFNRRVTWIFRPFSILTLGQIFLANRFGQVSDIGLAGRCQRMAIRLAIPSIKIQLAPKGQSALYDAVERTRAPILKSVAVAFHL